MVPQVPADARTVIDTTLSKPTVASHTPSELLFSQGWLSRIVSSAPSRPVDSASSHAGESVTLSDRSAHLFGEDEVEMQEASRACLQPAAAAAWLDVAESHHANDAVAELRYSGDETQTQTKTPADKPLQRMSRATQTE